MKTFNKIFVSIMAVTLLFTTSCLDDSMVDIEVEDFAGTPYIADFNEMPTAAGYIKRSFPGTTDPNQSYSSTFRVNLSSPWQLDEDLTLKIVLDDAAVLDFIADNPGFVLFPAEKHDFSEVTVTIPAGEREAEFDANFFTAGLSADDVFLVAFSIVETSNPNVKISGNFGTQYVKVGVANVYEGLYTVPLDWIYGGNGGNYGGDYDDWKIGTVSSVKCVMDYFYPYWPYPITITILDPENPQTIDGHDNAFYIDLDAAGKDGDDDKQLDDHEGGVWNYCYQKADGKWVFKMAHALTTGSGTHVGSGVFTQN